MNVLGKPFYLNPDSSKGCPWGNSLEEFADNIYKTLDPRDSAKVAQKLLALCSRKHVSSGTNDSVAEHMEAANKRGHL